MMTGDLKQRLALLTEQKERRAKLIKQLSRLELEQREARDRAEQLAQQLAKEQKDVERLESGSLSGLLASFFGNKEEKLYKERQEAEAAQLRYEEARVRAERLTNGLAEMRQELDSLAHAEREYNRLVAEKEQRIRAEQGPAADQLLRLDGDEQEANRQLKEIDEALRAGQSASASLDRVLASLRSAEGWGTWDMLGGGWIATSAKHSHMDDAQHELYAVQEALSRFRRELADVEASVHLPDLELDSFLRFADYFFDGLFVDIAVQSRIRESLRATEEAQGRVNQLIAWLGREATAARQRLQEAKEARARFVANHGGHTF